MTDFEKFKETQLPTYENFYSQLKWMKITEESDYQACSKSLEKI